MFGKLENGSVKVFEAPLIVGKLKHFKPSKEDLLEAGWKEIVYVKADVNELIEKMPRKTKYVEKKDTIEVHTEYVANEHLIKEFYTDALREALDKYAKNRGYSDIVSLCSYLNSTNEEYRREAEDAIRLRDEMWPALYEALAKLELKDLKSLPDKQSFLNQLGQI